MYPQTVVPLTSDIHNHLRDNHAGQTGDVKLLDGVYYTANRDGSNNWNPTNDATWEKNPVYQYGSDRYVRVTPWAYGIDDGIHKYNATADNPNPEQIERYAWNGSSFRWFRIDPIKWIILNPINNIIREDKDNAGLGFPTDLDVITVPQGATLELYAADVLMSGITYDVSSGATWNSERTMYKYLNTEFYNQAFSSSDKLQIQVSTIYNNTGTADRDNPAYSLNSNHLTDGSGMNQTEQKVYMLSHYELTNAASPYVVEGNQIFGPAAATYEASKRQVSGTDYARAHYLMLGIWEGKSYAQYWTRTAFNTTRVYCVTPTGGMAASDAYSAIYSYSGQRPALQLKLHSLV